VCGEAFWGFGSLWTVKTSAEQTGGRFALIEELAPGGVSTPLHRHAEDDEAFYVLEREITFYLEDDQPVTATAGWFVHVPGGAVHAFRGRLRDRSLPYHHHPARTLLPRRLR
jgi:mannose-6-phosphate isomerase-like protein (cupin superfamily)